MGILRRSQFDYPIAGMFDEPDETPSESPPNPGDRAKEKADEFRVHAQLAAVFEGPRKFDAKIRPSLDPQLAREIQRTMGRLEKSKPADTPVIPAESAADATGLLNLAKTKNLSTGDYHIHRRPGEVMIVRWLAGAEVETFYDRLQAHFDVAMNDFRDEEKAALEWQQGADTKAYLAALDAIEVRMAERYLGEVIRKHNIFVLSTQTADEMDILHLCDYVMGVPAAEVVGSASAPPEEPTERDRAWFFKLFSLRGMAEGVEQMCFFTYLQKSDESFE
jgi:hypothetical protein